MTTMEQSVMGRSWVVLIQGFQKTSKVFPINDIIKYPCLQVAVQTADSRGFHTEALFYES